MPISIVTQDLLDGKFGDNVDASVYERVEMFHTDSVSCWSCCLVNIQRVLTSFVGHIA